MTDRLLPIILLACIFSVALVACDQSNTASERAAEDAEEQTQQQWTDARNVFERQLEEFGQELEDLEANLDNQEGEIDAEIERALSELKDRRDSLQTHLEGFGNETDQTMSAQRRRISQQFSELEADFERLRLRSLDERSDFVEAIDEQTAELDKVISEVENRIEQLDGEARSEYQNQLQTLKQRRDQLQDHRSRLQEASQDEFQEMKDDVTEALAELSAVIRSTELNVDLDLQGLGDRG